eukprot:m.51471 g.51471  ORF g.51471 m.51471 type:complete len:730 (+) comp10736_c0_seq3:86-2275(+)
MVDNSGPTITGNPAAVLPAQPTHDSTSETVETVLVTSEVISKICPKETENPKTPQRAEATVTGPDPTKKDDSMPPQTQTASVKEEAGNKEEVPKTDPQEEKPETADTSSAEPVSTDSTSKPSESESPKQDTTTTTTTATANESPKQAGLVKEESKSSMPTAVVSTGSTDDPKTDDAAAKETKAEVKTEPTAPAKPTVPPVLEANKTNPQAAPQVANSTAPSTPCPSEAVPTPLTERSFNGSGPRPTNQLKWIGSTLMKSLTKHKCATPFLKPVDPVLLGIPTYFDVIKTPMDFGTVKKKLAQGQYQKGQEALDDIKLVFTNCKTFNNPTDRVTKMAEEIEQFFERSLKKLPTPEQELAPPKSKVPRAGKTPQATPQPVMRAMSQVSLNSEDMSRRPSRSIRVPVKDFGWESGTSQGKKSNSNNDKRLKFCHQVIKELFSKKHEQCAWPFYDPVDPVALNLPDYLTIIKKPMDLSTARSKLDSGEYHSAEAFIADIRLIFSNCLRYNPPGSEVAVKGQQLQHAFEIFLEKMPEPSKQPSSSKKSKSKKRKAEYETSSEEEDDSSSESESSESESESDSDDEADPKILAMSKMLEVLTKDLSKIHSKKSKRKRKSKSSKDKKKKKKPTKKRKTKTSSKKAPPKKRKAVAMEDSDDEEDTQMSYEQKKTLSEDIHNLPNEQLNKCVEIIKDRESSDQMQEGEDIVVDFAKLKDSTLYALQAFVKKCKRRKGR